LLVILNFLAFIIWHFPNSVEKFIFKIRMGEMQMQKAKYTAEFKEEAVGQVNDSGHSVIDVAKRLGIGDGLLYTWVSKYKVAN
jgi:hypothetical protein